MSEGLVVFAIVFTACVISVRAMKKHTLALRGNAGEPVLEQSPKAAIGAPSGPPKRKRAPAKPKANLETVDIAKTVDAKPAPAVVTSSNIAKAKPVLKTAQPTPTKKVKGSATPPHIAENNSGPGFKNPLTGEITAHFTNYRFSKRWLKEALVTEGLLDRLYKTHELNDALEAKIKLAVEQLAALKKYQA